MNGALQPGCDAPTRARAAGVAAVRRPNLVLATTILASSLAFIDGSVVNVALPAIGRSLGDGGIGLSWVVNGYLLPLGALLLVGGAAGDLYGRRRMLILGVALFACASVLCALSPSAVWLILGRVLQGAGAALLTPTSLAILGASFSGEARGRAIGVWAGVGAAAGAVGPLLGGWLVDVAGWPSIFYLNLPLAAAAIALAARYLPKDETQAHPPLDLPGAVLAAAGLTALTWGLTAASAAKAVDPTTGAALAGGAVLLALFLAVEGGKGDKAMMPLALFASAPFVGLTLLTLLLYGSLGGLLVLVPFLLIVSKHYSAVEAGAALLPLPLIIALTSTGMGRLAARIGPRLPLSIGPVVVAAGCLLGMRIAGPGDYWTTTLPAMLVISLGMAAAVAPLTTAVLSAVTPGHTGIASGLNSAVARIGGLVATALATVVLAAKGPDLPAAFRLAALVGAAVAAAAGACAFVWVRRGADPAETD